MIVKNNKYVKLFGLTTKSSYILLNSDNEVIMDMEDNYVITRDKSGKPIWVLKKKIKQFGIVTYIATKYEGKNVTMTRTLPNRNLILWLNDKDNPYRCPFIYFPEGKNKLEKFLVKNGIFNYNKIIKKDFKQNPEKPFEIKWCITEDERYPVDIIIYSNNYRINDLIIKALINS